MTAERERGSERERGRQRDRERGRERETDRAGIQEAEVHKTSTWLGVSPTCCSSRLKALETYDSEKHRVGGGKRGKGGSREGGLSMERQCD